MNDDHSARPPKKVNPGRKSTVPFAALPHHIAGDPTIPPQAKAVLLALLFWARGKSVCWPSDESIGQRIGRHKGTAQRWLRWLDARGLIAREKTKANPTGRLIHLRWRAGDTGGGARPSPAEARDELATPENEPKDNHEPAPSSFLPILEKAKTILPEDPGLVPRIEAMMREFTAPWVDRAFDELLRKAKTETMRSPFGFVARTLQNFAAQGGPPPAPLPRKAPAQPKYYQRVEEPLPTPEQIRELRVLAADTGALDCTRALARGTLARHGMTV